MQLLLLLASYADEIMDAPSTVSMTITGVWVLTLVSHNKPNKRKNAKTADLSTQAAIYIHTTHFTSCSYHISFFPNFAYIPNSSKFSLDSMVMHERCNLNSQY